MKGVPEPVTMGGGNPGVTKGRGGEDVYIATIGLFYDWLALPSRDRL